MNILVTGGAGFVGSNLVQYLLNKYPQYRIVNLDKLTYAGNLANLEAAFENPNHSFVKGISATGSWCSASSATTLATPSSIARRNPTWTGASKARRNSSQQTSWNAGAPRMRRESGISKFLQVSTDEVYGSLESGRRSTEETPLRPSNPYAASKAAADLLALAFYRTYGLPVVVTRCTNNYGQFQFPEN